MKLYLISFVCVVIFNSTTEGGAGGENTGGGAGGENTGGGAGGGNTGGAGGENTGGGAGGENTGGGAGGGNTGGAGGGKTGGAGGGTTPPAAGDDAHTAFQEKMEKFLTVDSNNLLETNLAVISMQVERIRKALQKSHRNNTKLKGTINRVRHDQTVTKAEKEKVQKDYNRQKAILIVYDELVNQYILKSIEEGADALKIKIDKFKEVTENNFDTKIVPEIKKDVEIRIDQATACKPLCTKPDATVEFCKKPEMRNCNSCTKYFEYQESPDEEKTAKLTLWKTYHQCT
eukprot:Mrub_06673.p1 GENE.Mrub_06673~~Mrub_06673.p1  ORF type:complete len:288 (+),score=74.39 Mrub_06673:12-875(+)